MGCYMEPEGESKLDFLNRKGKEITFEELLKYSWMKEQKQFPVVYFKNQNIVEVAGILYCEKELKRLIEDRGLGDRYFLVDLVDLLNVSNINSFI